MRRWIGAIGLVLVAALLAAGGAVYWIADDSGCDITSVCDTSMPDASLWLFIAAGAVSLAGLGVAIFGGRHGSSK